MTAIINQMALSDTLKNVTDGAKACLKGKTPRTANRLRLQIETSIITLKLFIFKIISLNLYCGTAINIE
jgi:hypothetical protein